MSDDAEACKNDISSGISNNKNDAFLTMIYVTYWGQYKIADILKASFNAFSCIEIVGFRWFF